MRVNLQFPRAAFAMFMITNVLGSMGWAEIRCLFTSECFETEACAETEFSLSYSISSCPRSAGPRHLNAQTNFGALEGKEIGNSCGTGETVHEDGAFFLYGVGATYLLSISDGNARLTTHIEGPLTVSYIGKCEVAE